MSNLDNKYEPEFKFDELLPGVKNMSIDGGQISLFDDIEDIQLPPINVQITKRKKVSKNKKTFSELSLGNATIGKAQSDKSKITKKIDIDSIKIKQESEKHSSEPLKELSITGSNKNDNSVVSVISTKTKEEIDKRNAELLKIRRHPYVRKQCVLTDAEKVCFKFLRARLNKLNKEITLLSKVRLADVVELNQLVTRDTAAFRKIAYKHLDYAILSPDLDLICIVELDDYTHETEKAQERDKFVTEVLQDCGIPFFRIKSRVANLSTDDTVNIEMCILEYLAPKCPLCGRPMEPKVSRQHHNYGHRFYGCLGWYEYGSAKCNYTIDID